MTAAGLLVLGGVLGAVFALLVRHVYDRRRKDAVESPKYRMLDDE